MKFFPIVMMLIWSQLTFAGELKFSQCSQKTEVCVEIQTIKEFSSKEEGRFSLVIKGEEVELKKVDLWMQMGSHGHGSSPLKVTQVAPGEFDITKAFFVMRGKWQIRVTFLKDGVEETLILEVVAG